ncbi:isochorismatase family cysteine hydrolase [Kitasatospora sp. NPDC004614]|uniref:isochorismatase family cysteine hydrolase n=1 Tax=unclassified Kitasatospora TaxID=2633591 RepID=UPI0036C03BA0
MTTQGRLALMLIDLQTRIVDLEFKPRSGREVVATARTLADAYRTAGVPVVVVQVHRPGIPEQPPGSELVDGVLAEGDLLFTKQAIGAFHSGELDTHLRERGIDTLVLAGLVTNMGVESTARAAVDHGYKVHFVEDAMAALTAEEHDHAFRHTFPRFGTVTTATEAATLAQPS